MTRKAAADPAVSTLRAEHAQFRELLERWRAWALGSLAEHAEHAEHAEDCPGAWRRSSPCACPGPDTLAALEESCETSQTWPTT